MKTRSALDWGTIAVVESEPNWGPELARQFPDRDVWPIAIPFDQLDRVEGSLPPSPIELLVIDAEVIRRSEPEQWLHLLTKLAEHTIVLTEGTDLAAEWQLRDIGAITVVDRTWTRPEVLTCCRRLLSSSESL